MNNKQLRQRELKLRRKGRHEPMQRAYDFLRHSLHQRIVSPQQKVQRDNERAYHGDDVRRRAEPV